VIGDEDRQYPCETSATVLPAPWSYEKPQLLESDIKDGPKQWSGLILKSLSNLMPVTETKVM